MLARQIENVLQSTIWSLYWSPNELHYKIQTIKTKSKHTKCNACTWSCVAVSTNWKLWTEMLKHTDCINESMNCWGYKCISHITRLYWVKNVLIYYSLMILQAECCPLVWHSCSKKFKGYRHCSTARKVEGLKLATFHLLVLFLNW